ncbi:choice-of-anchor Q domain-containing protein [Fibrella arboris]|uniref:choice-of-anchor Q domain-containing protein n=1 Tax=Fibrella arboris TaxID=3242486 RepID=UPI003521B063
MTIVHVDDEVNYSLVPVRIGFRTGLGISIPGTLLLCLLLVAGKAQTVRYVSATGTNATPATATSWAAATSNLQGAIDASVAGDQVWVRSGTYKPGGGSPSASSSFSMKTGVAIYGGFAGTETTLNQRVLAATPTTILSGDIGTVGNSSDNCNNVINNSANNLNSTAILDGFTISDASGATAFGGGMYNRNSSPTVRNCLFQNNSVNFGGGMAILADGSTASPTLINCSFLTNTANVGGGIYINGGNSGTASPTLINCSFQGNTAVGGGGAVMVITQQGTAAPQATNCILLGTILMSFNGAQPTFVTTNCLIQPGAVSGGAAGNFSQTNNVVTNSSPFVNTTSPQITDCSMAINAGLNSAPGLSGITTDAGGNPRLFPTSGGTVDIGAYEFTAVANPSRQISITQQPASVSLVCAGSAVSVPVLVSGSSPTFQWFRAPLGGVGVASAVSGATTATLTLPSAQTTDAGSFSLVITGCNTVTTIAFSLVVNPPLFVTPTGAGAQNGSSWANAYAGNALQTAINAAQTSCGRQVWVAAGTYKPTVNGTPTTDRDATFTMQPGVAIYGGFIGNEVALSQRPASSLSVPPSTTLSADIANNTNVSAYNLFRNGPGLTGTAILDGFVLAFALANNTGAQAGKQNGGAIYNNGLGSGNVCSPTIRNCWFMNNFAFGGSGIYNGGANSGNSSPSISNCRFENNQRAVGGLTQGPNGGNNGGGGIMNDGANGGTSNPVISNCLFRSNSSFIGGGILNNAAVSGVASPTIVNCLFQSNTTSSTTDGGSGIYNAGILSGTSSPFITNCSFLNNVAQGRGGAIVNAATGSTTSFSRPIITNCSFQGNAAPLGGGAVYNAVDASGLVLARLVNCVAFGNGEGFSNGDVKATMTLTYSLFEPTSVTGTGIDTSGPGNITTTVTPFGNTSSTELGSCSPAVNAGLNSTTGLTGITTDLAGSPRVTGGTVDMGAYESLVSLVAGSVGGPPIVPYPQESANILTSLTAASASATPITLTWQQSGDNGIFWTDIAASNAQSITLPRPLTTEGNPNKTYLFRRIITDACSRSAVSTQASVKVINSTGQFVGYVRSSDGITGVVGVTITAVRTTTGLAGSPTSWTYTFVTGSDGATDGSYNLSPIYYGVPAGTLPTSLTTATFTVTPTYADPNNATLVHTFSPASEGFTLNQFNSPKTINFTDLTTFGINGQTRQVCSDCITGFSGQTPVTGSVTCPVDGVSVKTFRNGAQVNLTNTAYLEQPAPGNYGRFAVAVNNPGSYSLTAEKTALTFTPAGQSVNVVTNVYNVNFDSPSSQTIVGRVAAGCNEAIGAVVLEFTDLLKDGNGTDRPSCFRKRVTTSATGFYTIELPRRKYKVQVISLTPNATAGVSSPDVVAFFTNQYPADSLIRDITSTTAVSTLNLTYQRPPTLSIAGLITPGTCGTAAGYSLMEQATPQNLTVTAWQGPVATGCPVSSGTVLVSTNIQVDTGETATAVVGSTGLRSLTIVPGVPNVIAPYYRYLNAQFTDAFGRTAAPLNRNVVVTGVKSGTASFQTVSPQIPLLVLHDPPGDGSYSFWTGSTQQEQTMRFSYSLGTTVKTWYQAKVGVKLLTGLFVITENSVFATLGGGITAMARNVNARETVITNTSSSGISTNNTAAAVGAGGDVFYGTAMNMWYSVATVLTFNPASCSVVESQQLIVANSGQAGTDFYYTADFIENTSIPNLRYLLSISTDSTQRRNYRNQIKVWQQVLDNNAKNKREAEFVRNVSFGGFLGDINSQITKSTRKANTIEYTVDIDNEVAVALGFEVAGNGFSGGVTVNLKTEIGGSETNSVTRETTTGYFLRDNTGDKLSVDVKTDPIYGTPVFELLGGDSSCPTEPGTLARDNFQLTAPITVAQNVAPGTEAEFTLRIGNISQVNTDASRQVWLSLDPNSNFDGALISVNGSPYVGPILYTVNRLSEVLLTVRVGKSAASRVYAYEGLRFQISDACSPNGGTLLKTVALSVYFQNPCSPVTLTLPDANWVSTIADNNTLPVLIGGYTWANLTNVTFQYRPTGGSSWTDAFTRTQAQLNNSVNGTQTTWNTTGLTDGTYDLRLKLTCPLSGGATGVVYSARNSGVFDRSVPVPLGNTQPTNSTYAAGSTIGIRYNENIACAQLSASNVVAKRLSNGQTVPLSLGCFQNQIVLTPISSLTPFTDEVISLTLTGVADVYGNARITPDSWAFRVGNTAPASTTNTLSIAVSGSPISESSTGAVQVVFSRPISTTEAVLVNFNVAGTTTYPADFTTAYLNPASQPLSATVNGVSGSILIPAGSTTATLLVRPVNDSFYEPDETIILTLLDGGNYTVGAASSVTIVIQNDDVPCTGTFTTVKAGSWADPTVWSCGAVPSLTNAVLLNHTVQLPASYTAQSQQVRYGASGRLTYQPGSRLRIGF